MEENSPSFGACKREEVDRVDLLFGGDVGDLLVLVLHVVASAAFLCDDRSATGRCVCDQPWIRGIGGALHPAGVRGADRVDDRDFLGGDLADETGLVLRPAVQLVAAAGEFVEDFPGRCRRAGRR
ncbi:hypothetical protein QP157_21425 [Sphingomonas sp. LR61]